MSAATVSALIYKAPVVFTCTGFSDGGTGVLSANRNNIGSNSEMFTVQVVDGGGNVIYSQTAVAVIGVSYPGWGAANYTSAPQYNPIRLYFISAAGNGFSEQS